jgi:hypothetical protein
VPTNQSTGGVAVETIGTPPVHVAVAEVAELIVTELAETPPKDAVAVYPEVKKLAPVKTIVFPLMATEVTAGKVADVPV